MEQVLVTAAELADDVAMLSVSTVAGVRPGFDVVVTGLGAPFDGAHTLATVDRTARTVTYPLVDVDIPAADVFGHLVVEVDWATTSDVLRFLGVQPASQDDEDYLEDCTASANLWAWSRRLAAGYQDLPTSCTAQVREGVTLYAATLYRERGAVDTFASFQELGGQVPVPGTLGQIKRLLGLDRPRIA